jgi:hypothetical protein
MMPDFTPATLEKGFVDGYARVRINATGRRFEIRNCTLRNVVDGKGKRLGQATLVREFG